MRILVTGAAGFMGSHLVDVLVSLSKHRVFAVDDLSGGYIRNTNPKAPFTKLDLRQKDKVASYMAKVKPELLFHLAADATEGRSQFTPISATERNLMAYMYTLIPAIKHGLKKVVLTSSMSVYGAQKTPFSEDMKPMPEDIYAVAKTAMEESTKILGKVYGFDWVIIRPHNVYGPKQNLADPYRNVVGIFINCLLHNRNFYIYGDGKQKRAFTYIDDFTPYCVKAGFSEIADGEIINIGPREEYTINELANIVLSKFFAGKKIPATRKPTYVPWRPQEVKEAFCTNDKAEKLLGYKTTVHLPEGVEKMIAWARTIGKQKFQYLKELELEAQNTPATWKRQLI